MSKVEPQSTVQLIPSYQLGVSRLRILIARMHWAKYVYWHPWYPGFHSYLISPVTPHVHHPLLLKLSPVEATATNDSWQFLLSMDIDKRRRTLPPIYDSYTTRSHISSEVSTFNINRTSMGHCNRFGVTPSSASHPVPYRIILIILTETLTAMSPSYFTMILVKTAQSAEAVHVFADQQSGQSMIIGHVT